VKATLREKEDIEHQGEKDQEQQAVVQEEIQVSDKCGTPNHHRHQEEAIPEQETSENAQVDKVWEAWAEEEVLQLPHLEDPAGVVIHSHLLHRLYLHHHLHHLVAQAIDMVRTHPVPVRRWWRVITLIQNGIFVSYAES
jgi:hypothetical protein